MTETTDSLSTTRPGSGWGPLGDEIVFRSRGAHRWLAVPFLCFWLCGWAAGELAVLWFLIARPMPVPVSGGGIVYAIGFFLLLWLAGWTYGGLSAMHEVARLVAGWEKLQLRAGECRYRTGIGPWHGPETLLTPQTVRRIGFRKRGGALMVETDRRELIVGRYATPTELAWLRGELQRLLRQPGTGDVAPVAPLRSPGSGPLPLPVPRVVRDLETGETKVTEPFRTRLGRAGCLTTLALLWNGLLLPLVAAAASRPERWGFAAPFVLIGLALLAGVAWGLLGGEEWIAAPGRFTLRRSFPADHPEQSYSHGSFEVTVSTDSDGDETWRLQFRSGTVSRTLQYGSPGALRVLGALLAHRTGWTLRCDPDLE